MFSNKRFLSAIAGAILMALPASALAADHHWDNRDHHPWVLSHNPGYATPPIIVRNPPIRYRAPRLGYANPGYPPVPYVAPYANSDNLGFLMEKRQQAYDAILAANRSGNTAGAHQMWEVYNNYNQRIASLGGGTLRY